MTEPSAPNITTGSNAEIFLNFSIPDEEVSPSGWAERKFQIAITSVDIFGCESYLNIFDETTQIIDANKCPEVTFYMTEEFFNNEFVETTKIYMKSTDSDTWYLQWYLNHKGNNVGNFYSNSSGMFDYGRSYNDNLKAWTLEREVNKDFNEINSYESESMVKQEDALRAANPQFSDYKSTLVFEETPLSKTGYMIKEEMPNPELTVSEGKTGQNIKYKNCKYFMKYANLMSKNWSNLKTNWYKHFIIHFKHYICVFLFSLKERIIAHLRTFC